MKIPRYDDPSKMPDNVDEAGWGVALPAVAVVGARGVLVECAPVVRFGKSRSAKTYALLSHDQRHELDRCVPNLDGLIRQAANAHHMEENYQFLLRHDGRSGSWINGENLWVQVSWLVSLPKPDPDSLSFGQHLMFDLIQALGKVA